MSSRFESLPNELLLDIFDKLDGVSLYRSFTSLNTRFNLLLSQTTIKRIDFRSVSKTEFDLVCKRLQPTQIIELTLSSKLETVGQINVFFSLFSLADFISLRSLVLLRLNDNELSRIVDYLDGFVHLETLSLTSNDSWNIAKNHLKRAFDKIFRLPKLTRCYLKYEYVWLNSYNYMSTSLQSITISVDSIELSVIAYILHSTPLLRRLIIKCRRENLDNKHVNNLPIMQHLIYSSLYNFNTYGVFDLLKHMPSLRHFHLFEDAMCTLSFAKTKWEDFFKQYLPELIDFRFMFLRYNQYGFNARDIPWLLEPYRTNYWLHDRRWFVRCDVLRQDSCATIRLYTLPYPLKTMNFVHDRHSQYIDSVSTDDDCSQHSFSSVRQLEFKYSAFLLEQTNFYFPNIEILDNNRCKFTSFEHASFANLRHIKCFHVKCNMLAKTIALAPRLRSLDLDDNAIKLLAKEAFIIGDIQQIIIQNSSKTNLKHICRLFNKTCKYLIANKIEQDDIPFILNRMPKLQSAIFEYRTTFDLISVTNWLQSTTTLVDFIISTRSRNRDRYLCIWIGNERRISADRQVISYPSMNISCSLL